MRLRDAQPLQNLLPGFGRVSFRRRSERGFRFVSLIATQPCVCRNAALHAVCRNERHFH